MRYFLARLQEPSTWVAGVMAAIHSGLIPPGALADFLVYFLSAALAGAPDGLAAMIKPNHAPVAE